MLENIHVKNIALIKEIDINLSSGLNIITGETGAGKSLIIGSVSLGLGARIPKDYIFAGENEALIELTFSGITEEVSKILEENDIEVENDTVIIQRRVTKTKTVNRINYMTVPLALLRQIGSKLMQIHGQHDNQVLLNKSSHIEILDAYAGKELCEVMNRYKSAFTKLIAVHGEIKKISSMSTNKDRDFDYYSYVLEEIDDADPELGEDEKLKEVYDNMINLQNSYDSCNNALYEIREVASSAVGNAISQLGRYKTIDAGISEIYSALMEVDDSLSIIGDDIDKFLSNINFDEEEFQKIDKRVDKLDALKRKYGGSIQNVLNYRDEAEKILDTFKNMDERLSELKKERVKVGKEVEKLANEITEIRKKYAIELQKKIIKNLEELNFLQVKFEFIFTNIGKFLSQGQDEVEMYISTNVGHDMKPLSNVSSGGELSRIMLAIQSIISNLYSVGGIIFDEVDAGISGKTGVMVAARLKEMAENMQVICITHLPQLAAVGDVNYKIEKDIVSGVTTTKLTELDEEGTIAEVARLLGGMEITEATMQNARELRNINMMEG